MNLRENLVESINAKKSLLSQEKEIFSAIKILYKSIKKGKKILICGNGGSAADAQHLSAEFIDRLRPDFSRKPLPILSLSIDSSHLTACSNDFGFENSFTRPLMAFGKKGDILLCISTSGNSVNILNALRLAKKMKINSISFLGKNGGKAKKLSDLNIIIKHNNVARIQESHIFIGHFILQSVENKLFKK